MVYVKSILIFAFSFHRFSFPFIVFLFFSPRKIDNLPNSSCKIGKKINSVYLHATLIAILFDKSEL